MPQKETTVIHFHVISNGQNKATLDALRFADRIRPDWNAANPGKTYLEVCGTQPALTHRPVDLIGDYRRSNRVID